MSDTENVGAAPEPNVESQAQDDQQAKEAVDRTQESNVATESHPDIESQAQDDQQAEEAVDRTQWSNVGTGTENASDSPLTADWSNVGLEQENQSDSTLTAEWTNYGLRSPSAGSTSLMAPPMPAGIRINTNPGISVFFTVSLDVIDLGSWSKISGLGMSIATVDRADTAMSFFQHHLPGHMTYSNITLERPVTSDSATVMNWISAYHMLPIPTAGQISCIDQSGTVVMTWELMGVTPVSWKGPSMDVYASNVATEVLTLAHMGFM